MSKFREDQRELVSIHNESDSSTKEKQASIKGREALIRYYLETVPIGVYQSDLEGNFLYANDKYSEILGYRSKEVIGKNIMNMKILSEKSLKKAAEVLRISKEDKLYGPTEIEMIGKDGHSVTVELISFVTQCESQKIINGFVRDIVDYKKMEEKLESKSNYSELVNFLPLPLFEMDKEGNITFGNPALLETFGYTQDDLEKGINVVQAVAPEQMEMLKSNITKALNGEKRTDFEYTAICKNGSTFPFILITNPIARDGIRTGLRGAIFDLTKQKRIERSPNKMHMNMQQLQRITHIGIWEWNIENAEIYVSDELHRITGTTPQMFDGTFQSFYEKIFPYASEIISSAVKKALEGEKNTTELRIVRLDGTECYARHQVLPLMDDTRRVISVTGVVQDITERIQIEKKMQNARDQLNQLETLASIGRLYAGVAHEILNSVNIVSMELQVLQSIEDITPEVLKELTICMDQVDRIITIAQNLRNFSRNAKEKVVDINDLLNTLLTLFSSQFKTNGIETEVHYHLNSLVTSLSKEKIEQVILNLISNAIDAMVEKETKVLRIKTEREVMSGNKQYLRIMIADTGTGIKTEHMSKIFDPFFSTKEDEKGMGLGLSVSHDIVHEYKGEIWAENNEWGGASFFVRLPAENFEKKSMLK